MRQCFCLRGVRALLLTLASFSLPEITAVDHQLPFDAVAFRAEQLQVVENGLPAFGNGNHVIEHKLFAGAAIGAAFASSGDQLPLPVAAVALQHRPLAPFDLRRRPPSGRAIDPLRVVCAAAARQKPTDIAVLFATFAAAAHPSAVAAAHLSQF